MGDQGGAAIHIAAPKMYVAGGKGLATLDISDPLKPTALEVNNKTGLLSDNGAAAMLAVGQTLYLAGGKGLGIYDISGGTPVPKTNVINTGVISSDGPVDLKIIGETLFVAAGKGLATFALEKLK